MKRCKSIRLVPVAAAAVLFCVAALAKEPRGDAPDLDAVRRGLPEKVTPISKQDLIERVPSFYCFEYAAQPLPGKRLWLRVSKRKWIERYPNGLESTFIALGHATVNGVGGTIVVKTAGDPEQTGTPNDGQLQAFIPDKGGERMRHLYLSTAGGNTQWTDLAEMRSVE